jgi:hypothetical protein
MYHYMQFDPYLIRGHNEQLRNEVSKLRLEKWLREVNGGGSRRVDFMFRLKSALHPLRRSGVAGR